MRTRAVAAGVSLVLVAGWSTTAPAAPAPAHPRVLSVAQIATAGVSAPAGHRNQSDVVVQSQVASSPGSPDFAVAVTESDLQLNSAGASVGVALTAATTHDGGASWQSEVVPGLTQAAGGAWFGVSWPTVAVAPHGVVYVVGAVRGQAACDSGLAVVRSDDAGTTYGAPVLVRDETSCTIVAGRSSIAVDQGAHSPHRGRVYLGWTSYRFDADGNDIAQIQSTSWSDDHGATWSTPVELRAPGSTYGTNLVVAPNGAVTDVYSVSAPDFSSVALTANTSFDGGRTFGPSRHIDDLVYSTVGGLDNRCCTATAAIDPVTGVIYVDSSDPRFQDNRFNDALIWSSPDGSHWSGPVKADLGERGLEHSTPAVAAYAGTVYVSWTLTPDPNGRSLREQVAMSSDGGRTFGAPATLGPDGDSTYAAQATGFGYWLGDVAGITAVAGRAYVAWPQASAPARGHAEHQTLWGAAVTA